MEFSFKNNNFDLIRLLAALQVLLFHTIDHLQIQAGYLNILRIFPGVPIFFVISGYLISASYTASSSPYQFFKNRFLRIYPSLWLCLLLGILSLYLNKDFHGEFHEIVLWVFCQMTFFQFYNHGLFSYYGTGVLNGSLWTISVELQFYLLLPFMYLLLKKIQIDKKQLFLIFIFFIILAHIHNVIAFYKTSSLLLRFLNISVFSYGMYFGIGIFLQSKRELIQYYLKDNFLLLFFAFIIWSIFANRLGFTIYGNHLNIVSGILLSILTISFAYTPILKINFNLDLSYGIYIYHMLIINMLVNAGLTGAFFYGCITILLTVVTAYLSWTLIEKPMLKLKNYSINFTKKSPHTWGFLSNF